MKHQPSLTTKQRTILNLLYRFRFVTSEQLSKALSITKATTNKRLKLLLEQNYIGRKYDRISREHAAYYLLPNGIQALKQISKEKYLPKVLQNIKHDTEASDQFIKHNLSVLDTYSTLRAQYGDKLQFFTKTQMTAVPYFPKQLPDAHIQLGDKNPRLFLLDVLHEDQPFFLATRAVVRYIDYANADRWPEQHEFPRVLLVCDSKALEKRLSKKMRNRIEEAAGIEFFITTIDGLKENQWRDMADSDSDSVLSLPYL